MSTIPFVYHLYHIPTKKHYYGVKFAKGCNPIDLWTIYFSTSKLVKQLIAEYGKDSFIVTVRRQFTDSKKALLWEHKVLRRLNAALREDWLNRHNGGTKFRSPTEHSLESRAKMSKKVKGIPKTEEHKQKMSQSALIDRQRRRNKNWKMPLDSITQRTQTRQERIQSKIINPYNEDRNKKMGNTKRGCKRHYLPDGSFIMTKP